MCGYNVVFHKTPASLFIPLHCTQNIPKLQSVCDKLNKGMNEVMSLYFHTFVFSGSE